MHTLDKNVEKEKNICQFSFNKNTQLDKLTNSAANKKL